MSPRKVLGDIDVEEENCCSHCRSTTSLPPAPNVPLEVAKFVFPILLAWGLAVYTARSEAAEQVKTEVAVIKATEQTHFEEIQRTLNRVDQWIARQEQKGK